MKNEMRVVVSCAFTGHILMPIPFCGDFYRTRLQLTSCIVFAPLTLALSDNFCAKTDDNPHFKLSNYTSLSSEWFTLTKDGYSVFRLPKNTFLP